MEMYTLGYAGSRAEAFFETLRREEIVRVVDVRLRGGSALSGFARAGDLPYLLERLAGSGYVRAESLAPSAELLDAYRAKAIAWDEYARAYVELLERRRVEDVVPRGWFAERAALLCSERSPERCHRRLAAEYLARRWGDVTIRHLEGTAGADR